MLLSKLKHPQQRLQYARREALPTELQTSLPSIEQIEATLRSFAADDAIDEEV